MQLSSEVRDLVAASAFSALLLATGVFVPLLGPAAGFFTAAPLIWVAGSHGPLAGVLGGALAGAALLTVLPPPVTLIFAIEHALPAWYLGWRIRRGRGIVAGSAQASAVVGALVLGVAVLLSGRGQDPVRALEQQMRESLAELQGAAGDGSQLAGDRAALSAGLEQVLAFVRRVFPALTLIGIFLECSLNSLLAARVLARGGHTARPPTLSGLRLPERLIWVLIAVLGLCWTPQRAAATAALNALLPLLLAYLLVGLSITLHLAARARLSRFARALFVSVLIVFPWLLAAPLALGLLDFRFGFRERWPLNPAPP